MDTSVVASFCCPTQLVFGVGAHERLPALVTRLHARRVFLVVDPALVASDVAVRVRGLLEAEGIVIAAFSRVEPDPSDTTVHAAYDACRAHGADAIVAIGGGSTIDVAKAVGILMTNGGRIADYEGIERFATPPLPLFAIPTTAGTGSEVSSACVVSDTARHVKMAIRHAAWLPARVAILDPLAVASMPAHVAAHAAIDAFVHAFESWLSKLANPFSDAVNLHAMTLIARSIRPFVADRRDPVAAMDLLCGSSMAAMSFGVTGLGNVHCMALPLGALFGIPHGLANALCLPTAATFNRPVRTERLACVATILGVDTTTLGIEAAADAALDAIRRLCADLGIPPRLRDAGVTADRIPELARRCFAADYNRWNPRFTSEDDFRALFASAL